MKFLNLDNLKFNKLIKLENYEFSFTGYRTIKTRFISINKIEFKNNFPSNSIATSVTKIFLKKKVLYFIVNILKTKVVSFFGFCRLKIKKSNFFSYFSFPPTIF